MRGDLVYEKLGEINPALVAEALPDAVPLYRLGGEDPKPPKKRPNLRKALVVCACLILAGILLVGGSIALSRSLMPPTGTEPVTDSDGRTESLPSTDLPPGQPVFGEDFRIYDGLGVQLLYVGIDPAHTDEITELQTILSRAVEPLDSAETAPSLYMTVGDTTYAVTRGAVFDQSRKETYALADGDWERFRELVETIVGAFPDGAMTLPVVLDYKEQELHPLDAYVCSLPVFAESEYASLYEISEVYLRLVGSGSEYRTPAFTAVEDRDAVYRVSIPEDAPLGDYELVVRMHSDHSAGNTDLEIISRTPAVTVAAHEKESRYDFFYECEKKIFRQDETISLTAGLINSGDDIYRWSTELSILPTVTLRTVLDGETLTYPMTTGLELEWSGELYHMTYNQSSKAEFQTVTPDRLPVGVYDLVLSFEGHEKVFEAVFRIMDTVILHRGDSYGLTAFRGSSYRVTLKQGDYEIRFSKAGGVPMGNIYPDAPAGWYDLIYTDVPAGWEDREESIIHVLKDFVYIPDEDMDIKLESDIGQVTVKPGDVFSCKVTVINQGNPINLYMPYDGMGVDVGLESRYNGTSTSASASPVQDDRQPDNYTFGTGESFTNTHTFYLYDNFPEGIYDLVMIWRGITVVIEDAVIVEKP